MTNQHDLAVVLARAFWDAGDALDDEPFAPYFDEDMSMVDTSGGGMPDSFWGYMAAILGKVLTITTAEQLDALPHKSLLLRQYTSAAGWDLTEVWERRNDVWHCLAAPLSPPSRCDGIPALPARLLWLPTWDAS